ncbi:MAG: hypothetical protein H6851_12035 [Geminicoccaceae bacterium]|nr:hypothetical protein [Geminicoccaceae bacterium]
MSEGRGLLQGVIEQMLDRLASETIGLTLLRDATVFTAVCDRFAIRRTFPLPPVNRRNGRNQFWLRFERSDGGGIAAVAVTRLPSDDLFEDIRRGDLWYSGGFPSFCGLESIACMPPSRLVGGQVSMIDIHLAGEAGAEDTIIETISHLTQALAFRHHECRFTAMVPDPGVQTHAVEVLARTFNRCDPCIDGLMPFAEHDVSSPLMHTSHQEFLTYATNLRIDEIRSETANEPAESAADNHRTPVG